MDHDEYKHLRRLFFASAFSMPASGLQKMAAEAGMTKEQAEEMLRVFAVSFQNAAAFARKYAQLRPVRNRQLPLWVVSRNGRKRFISADFSEVETRLLAEGVKPGETKG